MNWFEKQQRLHPRMSKAKQKHAADERRLNRQVLAGFCVMILAMVGWASFRSWLTNRQAIDEAIERWRLEYHLSEEQTTQIRQIEEAYHGTGTIFTWPSHSIAEIADHQPSISRIMNPEDGARFLAEQERIAKSKPRHVRAHAH